MSSLTVRGWVSPVAATPSANGADRPKAVLAHTGIAANKQPFGSYGELTKPALCTGSERMILRVFVAFLHDVSTV